MQDSGWLWMNPWGGEVCGGSRREGHSAPPDSHFSLSKSVVIPTVGGIFHVRELWLRNPHVTSSLGQGREAA